MIHGAVTVREVNSSCRCTIQVQPFTKWPLATHDKNPLVTSLSPSVPQHLWQATFLFLICAVILAQAASLANVPGKQDQDEIAGTFALSCKYVCGRQLELPIQPDGTFPQNPFFFGGGGGGAGCKPPHHSHQDR
jgi:hypothetical protein